MKNALEGVGLSSLMFIAVIFLIFLVFRQFCAVYCASSGCVAALSTSPGLLVRIERSCNSGMLDRQKRFKGFLKIKCESSD